MMNTRLIALALGLAAVLISPRSASAEDNHIKGDKPIRISHGEPFALQDYVVTGKTTIFDFYSDYCPPCRALAPQLEKLHETHPDIALVIVDINRAGVKGIDWKSPVARQYELESIPQLKIFGPDGKLKAEGDAAREMAASLIGG